MPERAFAAELQHLANRFRKCLLDVMGRQVVQGRLLCSAQLWEATDPGAVRRGPCSPCSLALAASASAPGCAAPRSRRSPRHPSPNRHQHGLRGRARSLRSDSQPAHSHAGAARGNRSTGLAPYRLQRRIRTFTVPHHALPRTSTRK